MIQRHGRSRNLHSVVEHNGVLYVSGVTADDKSQAMEGQTREILTKLGKILEAHGSSLSKVLTATNYITDMEVKDGMNTAWAAAFAPENLPARATIGVASLSPGTLVEIMVIAAR